MRPTRSPTPGVRARLLDETAETTTDEDGFFQFRFAPGETLPADRIRDVVDLELLAPNDRTQAEVRTTGRVIVLRPDAEFGVFSDIDDTVIRSDATNTLRMDRVMLLNNGWTRLPLEGVAAFYEALQNGPEGTGINPVFFVSSSPVNYYSHFEHFLDARGIPLGPILLKDFGFSEDKVIESGPHNYKLEHIGALLDAYPDLAFVLIGDSRQKDAEICKKAVERYGAARFRANCIRDVTPGTTDDRDRAVQALADGVHAMGVPCSSCRTRPPPATPPTRGSSAPRRSTPSVPTRGRSCAARTPRPSVTSCWADHPVPRPRRCGPLFLSHL